MKKLVLAALMAIAVSSLPASIRNRETDRAVVHAQDIDPRYYAMGNPAVTDIWVDPVQGSDSNNGAARSSAVQTVNEAWNRIPSSVTPSNGGFRIQLVAGDYPESIFPSSNWMADRWGTYQFPIIIQSVDGPLTARIHAYLNFFDVKYTYLIGLDFVTDPGYGSGGNVIHIASSDHILIKGCRVNGFDGTVRQPQEAFKVNQVQYIYVEDSEFSGGYWFSLDYVAVQYGHIQGCLVHDSGDDGLVLKGGSAYLRVEGNEIYNTGVIGFTAGQGTGLEFMVAPWLHYEAYDLKFINNIVHDTQNAGMAVRGGYNILMAYNTLYRVGIGDAMFLAAQGGRSCDGDTADCASRAQQGGWGPTTGGGEWIPNRNVFVYNNIFYNPAPYQTQWSHFDVHGPAEAPGGMNIPSPALADDGLSIRGNIIWNGSPDMAIGIEDSSQGCQSSNSSCNTAQLQSDNSFDVLEPQLVDPANGDFRPTPASNILNATTFAIPAFPGGDRPQPPLSPAGNYDNTDPRDWAGNQRPLPGVPGAYSGSALPPPPPPPSTYAIAGQVTAVATGSGLSGVSMTLSGSANATAMTDSSGHYSFPALQAAGNYMVTPSARKFVFTPATQTVTNLGSNQTLDFSGRKKKRK